MGFLNALMLKRKQTLLRHSMRKHCECRARDYFHEQDICIVLIFFFLRKHDIRGKLLRKLVHSPRKPCEGQCEAAGETWGGRRLLRPCPLRTPCPPSSPRQRWTRKNDCTRTNVNAQAHLPALDNYCERAVLTQRGALDVLHIFFYW